MSVFVGAIVGGALFGTLAGLVVRTRHVRSCWKVPTSRGVRPMSMLTTVVQGLFIVTLVGIVPFRPFDGLAALGLLSFCCSVAVVELRHESSRASTDGLDVNGSVGSRR